MKYQHLIDQLPTESDRFKMTVQVKILTALDEIAETAKSIDKALQSLVKARLTEKIHERKRKPKSSKSGS